MANRKLVYPELRMTQKLSKRVPVEGGSIFTKVVPDGEEELVFSTEICMDALGALVRRAAKNGGGQAVDGALRVKILRRRKL